VGDFAGAIARSVVDEDDLVVRIGQPLERCEAVLDGVGRVVRADNDRHTRPRRARAFRKWRVFEGRRDAGGGRFQAPLPIDEPELPVVDVGAATPPFIGPRKCDRAARPFLERGANVHRGDLGLARVSLTNGIGAGFGEQQRLVSGDVLQSREIGPQIGFVVQVDVEGVQIEERQIEKLRRRKIHVREQGVRHSRFRLLIKAAEEPFDPQTAVPPNDARRNLVAEREQRDRRMTAQLPYPGDGVLPDVMLQPAIVEKRDVLGPGQPHHHAQTLARSLVEQFSTRRGVRADRVDAEPCHQTEVFSDLLRPGVLVAGRVGREGAVGDALDEEPVVARAQKFSVRREPGPRKGRPVFANLEGSL
jgi:hypothetical protein